MSHSTQIIAIHPDGVALLSDPTVQGNRFLNSGKRAIEFSLVSGGSITGNTFEYSGKPRALCGNASPQEDSQPVLLKQCKDIGVKDNRP